MCYHYSRRLPPSQNIDVTLDVTLVKLLVRCTRKAAIQGDADMDKRTKLTIFAIPLILGILLVVTGIIYGSNSHQTIYQTTAQNTIAHYLSDGKTGYVQLSDSPTLYMVDESSFTPPIKGLNTFRDGDKIALVFSPGDTTSVDKTSTLGTHLQGTAYKVVQITAFTDNGSQTVYSTSEYTTHPQGMYQNTWGVGIGLIVLGLLLALCSLFYFLPQKQPRPAFSAIPPSTPAISPAFNPYQQLHQRVSPAQHPSQPSPQQTIQPTHTYSQPQYPAPSEQFGSFGPTVPDTQLELREYGPREYGPDDTIVRPRQPNQSPHPYKQ